MNNNNNRCEICDRNIDDVEDVGYAYYDNDDMGHYICKCCWESVVTTFRDRYQIEEEKGE